MTSLAAEIQAPQIHYVAIAPLLVLFGGACLGVIGEALLPARLRWSAQTLLALVTLVVAFLLLVADAGHDVTTAGGAVALDPAGRFLIGTLLVFGLIALLLVAERRLGGSATGEHTEVFPLALFALAGGALFVTSNDLLLMFVALEVLSLPLYVLCGLSRRRGLLAQEASLKYFLLGAFASAFFLYGVALLYGYAGSVSLPRIHDAIAAGSSSDTLLLLGFGLLVVGLLFKAGLAPFHSWTPDVYVGAPTPITALMASCTKVAAFGGILRVLYVAFAADRWNWRPVLIGVAIATMLIGALFAATQTDIKRLLAYSSIANAGFITLGAVAATSAGLSSTLFYLVAYGFATLGAFALVTLVRDATGEATHLAAWAGLGRRAPVVAAIMTLFLLAFAGLPLTSGFTAKFAVFSAALTAHAVAPVIVGVVASMILAFPYLRLVVVMYFGAPTEKSGDIHIPGLATAAVVTVGALATVLLGVAPQPLLELASDAAFFVR